VSRSYLENSWGAPVGCELTSAIEAERRWRYFLVDSSVVGYSPDNNEIGSKAEESPLLRAVTM
jgi:hypothetical protein